MSNSVYIINLYIWKYSQFLAEVANFLGFPVSAGVWDFLANISSALFTVQLAAETAGSWSLVDYYLLFSKDIVKSRTALMQDL